MKKNKFLSVVFLLIIIFLNACKEQKSNTISEARYGVQNSSMTTISADECQILLKELISQSSFQSPFKDNFNVEIDEEEGYKLTLRIIDELSERKNTVGWIILDAENKKLLDITNDLDEPEPLTFDTILWDKVIDCYFKSKPIFKIDNNLGKECRDITNEYETEQICIFKNTTIDVVYQQTIKENELENASKYLLANIPENDTITKINADGLISIDYKIAQKKIEMEFLFEGGITTLIIEQQENNVERKIIYSAD